MLNLIVKTVIKDQFFKVRTDILMKIRYLISSILIVVLLFSTIYTTTFGYSSMGSRGSEVRQIQQRLKDWDYYKGSVDGIYGTKTRSAVIKFQKNHNITADGICGRKT